MQGNWSRSRRSAQCPEGAGDAQKPVAVLLRCPLRRSPGATLKRGSNALRNKSKLPGANSSGQRNLSPAEQGRPASSRRMRSTKSAGVIPSLVLNFLEVIVNKPGLLTDVGGNRPTTRPSWSTVSPGSDKVICYFYSSLAAALSVSWLTYRKVQSLASPVNRLLSIMSKCSCFWRLAF
jgi:hypothetical protein